MLALSLLLLCGFANAISEIEPVDVHDKVALSYLTDALNWYNKAHPNDKINSFIPVSATGQQNYKNFIYRFSGTLISNTHPAGATCHLVITIVLHAFKKNQISMTYSC